MISAFCGSVGTMFIPPSVTPISRSKPFSSNIARWLSTLPVRRPMVLSSTARNRSPVLMIPFITISALPVETNSTACIAARRSSATCTIRMPSRLTPAFCAAASIRAWSPNRENVANFCSYALWQACSTASSWAAATATRAGSDFRTSSISSAYRVIMFITPPTIPAARPAGNVSSSCG